jgi:hypothetical protein
MDIEEKNIIKEFLQAFFTGIEEDSEFSIKMHSIYLDKFFAKNFSERTLYQHGYNINSLCLYFIKKYSEILSMYGITIKNFPDGEDIYYNGRYCEFVE